MQNTPSPSVAFMARKEIRQIVRDGRLRLLGAIVLALAMAALAFGASQTHRAAEARDQARQRASDNWQGQGQKNPHVAAHYGTYVFAPTSVATAIDPGVSAYLGRSVKIEAHQRNLAAHTQAQDSASVSLLGSFSVSMVLLQLVPLLIIALGYGMWAAERERGTLRQVLSTGVDRRALFWGKALALGTVTSALLVPAGMIIVGVLWALGGGNAATLIRLGLLALGYGVYFTVFASLTLYASATARSSRAALVGMIAIWGAVCIIAPRLSTEIAGAAVPLPSKAAFEREVAHSLEKGIDGKTDREATIGKFTEEMMAAEGFENAGILMDDTDLSGFELRAEAKWEDTIYDHHVETLQDKLSAQETAVSWASFLSPYVAMRALSAGLCGTDYAHHRHFTDRAGQWRKELVGMLNDAFAKNAGDQGWEYRAGPELWKKAPPFTYTSPSPTFALQTHAASALALLVWLALALGLALWSARRVRVS